MGQKRPSRAHRGTIRDAPLVAPHHPHLAKSHRVRKRAARLSPGRDDRAERALHRDRRERLVGDDVGEVFTAPIAAKAWLATFAVALAVVQISPRRASYGRLEGVLGMRGDVVSVVHRRSVRLAVLLTLPVVLHCVFILGFQTSDARVPAHSGLGSFIYGVVAATVFLVRNHSYPAWVLPVAGGTLFSVLALLWATSSLW